MDVFTRKRISNILLALIILGALFLAPTIFNFILTFAPLFVMPSESLLSLMGILFAVITAIVIYYSEARNSFKTRCAEQIRVLSMLKSELIILHGIGTELYGGGTTIGNLLWYKIKINEGKVTELIHPINKLSFENYIFHLNEDLCKRINFVKLVRTLSWLNDKIYTINQTVGEARRSNNNQVADPNGVIPDALSRLASIEERLDDQIADLRTKVEAK